MKNFQNEIRIQNLFTAACRRVHVSSHGCIGCAMRVVLSVVKMHSSRSFTFVKKLSDMGI